MTLLPINCSTCGRGDVSAREMGLHICVDTGTATYFFRCPSCLMIVLNPANSTVIKILTTSGVSRVEWRYPAEGFLRPAGPPICDDDMIDFHEILSRQDWFDKLLSLTDLSGLDVSQSSTSQCIDWSAVLHTLYPLPPID